MSERDEASEKREEGGAAPRTPQWCTEHGGRGLDGLLCETTVEHCEACRLRAALREGLRDYLRVREALSNLVVVVSSYGDEPRHMHPALARCVAKARAALTAEPARDPSGRPPA